MGGRNALIERQWRILCRLTSTARGLTIAELAAVGGVGERTARRDLEALDNQFGAVRLYSNAGGPHRFRIPRESVIHSLECGAPLPEVSPVEAGEAVAQGGVSR